VCVCRLYMHTLMVCCNVTRINSLVLIYSLMRRNITEKVMRYCIRDSMV